MAARTAAGELACTAERVSAGARGQEERRAQVGVVELHRSGD